MINNFEPTITIVGAGYVGLVTGVCLANKNNRVYCVDVVPEKITKINKGIPPIFEEGLEEMLRNAIQKKKLVATLDLNSAVIQSDVVFITVPTPSSPTGEINLKYIKKVSIQIGAILKQDNKYRVVIVKSTVLPGTTINIVGKTIEEVSGKKIGRDFGLVMNPEFLREGMAVHDFLHPDRIVIGAIDDRSFTIVKTLYSWADVPIIRTNPNSAELIKYASNSFLAMKISFINEIANYAEKVGVDVKEVAEGIGLDHRISKDFLNAGIGFGGSCFPKDVLALLEHSKKIGRKMRLLEATLEVNKNQPLRVIDMLQSIYSSLENLEIAVLGLAFKPGTDDMREAPSIKIINRLLELGAFVKAHDPVAIKNAKKILGKKNNLFFSENLREIVRNADVVILVTDWNEYKSLSPSFFKEIMRGELIIDGRRIWDPKKFKNTGLIYMGIGYGGTISH